MEDEIAQAPRLHLHLQAAVAVCCWTEGRVWFGRSLTRSLSLRQRKARRPVGRGQRLEGKRHESEAVIGGLQRLFSTPLEGGRNSAENSTWRGVSLADPVDGGPKLLTGGPAAGKPLTGGRRVSHRRGSKIVNISKRPIRGGGRAGGLVLALADERARGEGAEREGWGKRPPASTSTSTSTSASTSTTHCTALHCAARSTGLLMASHATASPCCSIWLAHFLWSARRQSVTGTRNGNVTAGVRCSSSS